MMQTFTPQEYLKIDIANNFGLDKLDWEDRLAWFDANEAQLPNLVSQAEAPALFYSGVKAWLDTKAGKAIGYPISLDATASGIQILSVLTGDRSAALLSNVLDAGKRMDAYTGVYEEMLRRAGQDIQLTRATVKDAVMTSCYGSEAQPKKAFGEGPLLEIFYQTMDDLCPGIWQFNQAMLAWWDPTATQYSWKLPDNFHVHIKVMNHVQETVQFLGENHHIYRKENLPMEQGRSLGANLTHSVDGFIVRELTRRCNYNPLQIQEIKTLLRTGSGVASHSAENAKMTLKLWTLYQQSGILSARILDYLDYATIHLVDQSKIRDLLNTLPRKPFPILSIHDCFRVHPNYGNDLRRQYIRLLHEIAGSNLLQFLLDQMLRDPVQVTKLEDFSQEVLDSNYALS